jgi:hypothetical protein
LYEFCVIPRIGGPLRTETVTRVGGRGSFFSDEYHPLDMVARNPDFEVRDDVNKLEGEPYDNIIISYIIQCKDGDRIKNGSRSFHISAGCLCKDQNIEISPRNDTISFDYPHYEDEFNITVKFHEAGTYSVPELEIGDIGNSSIYLFPDHIAINQWWHKYSTEFALLVSLILLPSIVNFIKYLNMNKNKVGKSLNKKNGVGKYYNILKYNLILLKINGKFNYNLIVLKINEKLKILLDYIEFFKSKP